MRLPAGADRSPGPNPARGEWGREGGAGTLFLVLLLLGAVIRVYFAWLNRFCLSPDFGVVAVTATHIAEGRSFPFFLPGQAYIGTLEPAVSAIFCRILGTSEFSVSLGTALSGFFIIPIVYFWGRDAGGSTAGLMGMSLCIVGSPWLMQYSIVSVGGYALTMLFASALLWISSRWLDRERRGIPVPRSRYLLLGIVGGAAWWTYSLILTALLTSALLFLTVPRRLFSVRVLGSVGAGFLGGSFPFWWWNLTHHWETFRLSRAFEGAPFLKNLSANLRSNLPEVMGWRTDPAPIGYAAAVVATVILALLLVRMIFLRKSERISEGSSLAVIVLFFAVHVTFLSMSKFGGLGSPRYLLPLVHPLSVLLGVSLAEVRRRRGRGVALLCLTLLLAPQFSTFLHGTALSSRYREARSAAAELGDFLRQEEIHRVFVGYPSHGLNFALRERVTFSQTHSERIPAYGIEGEMSDRIAVLNNTGNVDDFLSWGGGTALQASFRERFPTLHYDLRPPGPAETLPPGVIETVSDAAGRDLKEILTDGSVESSWESPPGSEEEDFLEVSFREPVTITGFRIFSTREKGNPETWELLKIDRPGDSWTPLSGAKRPSSFFWSGPRIYWGGELYRVEGRFPPAEVSALRLRRTSNRRGVPWETAEIQFFGAGPELAQVDEEEALPDLMDLLRRRGVTRLYSDRWVGNAVARAADGEIATHREPNIFHGGKGSMSGPISLTSGTALVVRNESASSCRASLRERRVEMREEGVGPWVLFSFAPGEWRSGYETLSGLSWAGFSCFKGSGKRFSERMFREAEEYLDRGGEERSALGMLTAGLEAYEGHAPIMKKLMEISGEEGEGMGAKKIAARYRLKTRPEISAPVTFSPGIELVGVTFQADQAVPGGEFRMDYYWRVPEHHRPGSHMVFVHFLQDGIRFQDDHPLLADLLPGDVEFQPFDELFREERVIGIPADVPPGDYAVALGILKEGGDERSRVETELPADGGKVFLPATLHVIEE